MIIFSCAICVNKIINLKRIFVRKKKKIRYFNHTLKLLIKFETSNMIKYLGLLLFFFILTKKKLI